MFAIATSGTLVRPLFVNQSIVFTIFGAFNSVVLGAFWWYLRSVEIQHIHRLLTVIVGSLALLPLIFISGGVNSQFIVIFPCIPFVVCLILGVRANWSTCAFLAGVVVLLIVLRPYLPDVSNGGVQGDITLARGVWLVIACLVSSTFGSAFFRVNSTLNKQLAMQAFEDELTKVANRRSIMDQLKLSFDLARQVDMDLSIMMIDVDHFKSVNDRYGHAVGDECLLSVAAKIKTLTREKTDYVGRYGGEEFLVILPETSAANAAGVAENIRQGIEKEAIESAKGITIYVTASIGVASYRVAEPKDATSANTDVKVGTKGIVDIKDLLEVADAHLYQAKESGRNRVVG